MHEKASDQRGLDGGDEKRNRNRNGHPLKMDVIHRYRQDCAQKQSEEDAHIDLDMFGNIVGMGIGGMGCVHKSNIPREDKAQGKGKSRPDRRSAKTDPKLQSDW